MEGRGALIFLDYGGRFQRVYFCERVLVPSVEKFVRSLLGNVRWTEITFFLLHPLVRLPEKWQKVVDSQGTYLV